MKSNSSSDFTNDDYWVMLDHRNRQRHKWFSESTYLSCAIIFLSGLGCGLSIALIILMMTDFLVVR